jgi:hypothetical protein
MFTFAEIKTLPMFRQIVALIPVILIAAVLQSCIGKDDVKQTVHAEEPTLPNGVSTAIPMVIPHDPEKPFSLYGIELGETRESVQDKYDVFGCRTSIYHINCTINLDTRGVEGVSMADKTFVFIEFNNNEKYDTGTMSMLVFPADHARTMEVLEKTYGGKGEKKETMTIWENASGRIELDDKDRNKPASGLRYIAR